MAAPRRSRVEREPDSSPAGTDRNAALAALAGKGEAVDAPDPVRPATPPLTGVVHDFGGDVSAVLTSPSHVFRVGGRTRFVYRGEVVKAEAGFVDSRPFLVRL